MNIAEKSTIAAAGAASAETRAAYYAEADRRGLSPLWEVMCHATPRQPVPVSVPHHWRWRDVRPSVLAAGDLLSAWEAERRVLMLINPACEPTSFRTVGLIYAGIQLVMPGEKAPTHRHVPNAQRFVIEGEGAYTNVDGEQTVMARGDFVLTPGWSWHDHGNESSRPMMWLDGLDLPFINMIDVNFAEDYADGASTVQPIDRADGTCNAIWGRNMLPAWDRGARRASPIINYRWKSSREALHRLRDEAGCPFDGVILRYNNPVDGGPTLPTIAASLQLLRPGRKTGTHRHTASTIYHVAEGRGISRVGDREFDWEEGDTFVVPSWAWHWHEALGGEAVLFAYTDRPIIEPFGFHREEVAGQA